MGEEYSVQGVAARLQCRRTEVGMPNDAREVATRWFSEVWNGRQDSRIDELMAENVRGTHPAGEFQGRDGFRQMQRMFLSALPDVHIVVEDIIADGERVAVRWRATGTHTGDGFGFPASNRPFNIQGSSWMRVRDGKAVEGCDTWDLNGLLASLRSDG